MVGYKGGFYAILCRTFRFRCIEIGQITISWPYSMEVRAATMRGGAIPTMDRVGVGLVRGLYSGGGPRGPPLRKSHTTVVSPWSFAP